MSEEAVQPAGPQQEEKIMAALAHAATMLSLIGLAVSMIIWVTQKDKSAYVKFQALQAVAYQLCSLFFGFIFMGCYMCSIIGTSILATGGAMIMEENESFLGPMMMSTFFVPFIVFGAGAFFFMAFKAYGLIAAVMALQGRDFRYIILGQRVEEYLEKQ